jgi:hypothetical protein
MSDTVSRKRRSGWSEIDQLSCPEENERKKRDTNHPDLIFPKRPQAS